MTNPITLHEIGIVIVGQNHNPSILNPDFLWRNRIVSKNVHPAKGQPSFNTPMISQCVFENGLHIISEPNKISFIKTSIGKKNDLCYEVAKKYLRTVPLVHYTAVGINFFGFLSASNSEYAPHDLLSRQARDTFEDVSPSAEIVLTYTFAERTVNLTISDRIIASDSEHKVAFRGNFHRDIQAGDGESHKVAIAIADGWKNDLESFQSLVKNISESMGTQ